MKKETKLDAITFAVAVIVWAIWQIAAAMIQAYPSLGNVIFNFEPFFMLIETIMLDIQYVAMYIIAPVLITILVRLFIRRFFIN